MFASDAKMAATHQTTVRTDPCATDQPLRPGNFVEIVAIQSFLTGSGDSFVEEQEWISDPSYRRITIRCIRDIHHALRAWTSADPRVRSCTSQLPSHESAIGESIRILLKRKWVVISVLVTIFVLVAIASLKMTPVYEAGGTIEINKPDASLNFQNSATFSLDYYDPTELETELKILQSDLLAMQVIRELNLDRRPEFAGQAPPPSSSMDLTPDPLIERSHPSFRSGWKL